MWCLGGAAVAIVKGEGRGKDLTERGRREGRLGHESRLAELVVVLLLVVIEGLEFVVVVIVAVAVV